MHAALAGTPKLFALDWGTSSLRAYALGPGGQVLATRRSEHGVMNLPAGPAIHTPAEAFEAALQALCGDWLAAHPDTPLIACGMVGSAQGWREARYQPLPARASELATAMTVIARPGGAAFASPLMRATAQAPEPHHDRVIFVYTPQGAPNELWKPDTCGNQFSLRSASAPLEPVKSHCVFFRDFFVENAGHGVSEKVLGGGFTAGRETTLDIRLGEALAAPGQVPNLHMGADAFQDGVSKKDNLKVPFMHSSAALYELLFQREGADATLNHPLDQKFRAALNAGAVDFDTEIDLQIELSALALSRNSTNVITLMWGDHQGEFYLPYYPDGLPQVDFHQAVAGLASPVLYGLFRAYLSAKLAYLIQLLHVWKDSNGRSLLETTLVVHVSDQGDGRSHSGDNAPYLIAGGKNRFRNGLVLDVSKATQYDLMNTIATAYGLTSGQYSSNTINGLLR